MKNSISPTLIFLIQLVCLIVFFPMNHCRVVFPNNDSLIDQTCHETPNYDLCVSSLKSDPQSSNADVKGLALIMVNVVKAKATETLNQINELLKQKPGDQSLSSCVEHYNTVLQADVPKASDALTKGDPTFAEQGMNNVFLRADACENGFSGCSPLTDQNHAVRDLANVATAIVEQLLEPPVSH